MLTTVCCRAYRRSWTSVRSVERSARRQGGAGLTCSTPRRHRVPGEPGQCGERRVCVALHPFHSSSFVLTFGCSCRHGRLGSLQRAYPRLPPTPTRAACDEVVRLTIRVYAIARLPLPLHQPLAEDAPSLPTRQPVSASLPPFLCISADRFTGCAENGSCRNTASRCCPRLSRLSHRITLDPVSRRYPFPPSRFRFRSQPPYVILPSALSP